MNLLLRSATALAAPAGPRGRLSVFYFHRVLEKPDPLLPSEPDSAMFDRMLGWIGSQFRVLHPVDACERLYDGTLPSRAAIVTFDDGYRDNFTVALPILQRRGLTAAFFVSTGFLQGGMMFNDRVIEAVRRCHGDRIEAPRPRGEGVEALPLRNIAERRAAIDRVLSTVKHLEPTVREECVARLEQGVGLASARDASTAMMMSPEQVAGLHKAGMEVGGHTRSHPILAMLDDEAARQEIDGGLADLEAITGARPAIFAYPNGRRGSDFEPRHVRMVEAAGARFAFTTHAGAGHSGVPRFELPRFTPWDRTRLKFGARALLNLLGRVH